PTCSRILLHDGKQALREIVGKSWTTDLIPHNGNLIASSCEPKHCADKIAPVGGVEPGGADNQRARIRSLHAPLALQLRCAVDILRIGWIVLVVWRVFVACKDVVGRKVNDWRAGIGRSVRHGLSTRSIDRKRTITLRLSPIDLRERGGIDDN